MRIGKRTEEKKAKFLSNQIDIVSFYANDTPFALMRLFIIQYDNHIAVEKIHV